MSRNQRQRSWKSSSSQKARSLRTEYRLISNDALSNRSGGMDGRPPVRYIASKVGDSSARARSAKRLIVRSGWWAATAPPDPRTAKFPAVDFGHRASPQHLFQWLLSPVPPEGHG